MRFAIVLAGLLVVGAACSDSHPMSPAALPTPSRPRIIAHRGASTDETENTIAAFKRAWDLGVEGVELDVRVSRDGQVIVMHDDNTKRLTGVDKLVAEQTLAELKKLELPKKQRIPTLREAMATIPPGRAMFVEIKTGIETVPAVAAAIRASWPSNTTIMLQGFDADTLVALATAVPDAPAYWTVDPPLDEANQPLPYPREVIDEAVRRKFAGLALLAPSVDDNLLAAARDAGILIDVWTLNDVPSLSAWAGREVRWMETDRPDLAPMQP
ncbi:MAG TPA: glycerophosphodiester phosphodiesterase family protein [Kofleriaceae bacterium]|nr:glycerophosphodiester phosphodiesterase family protein [Kofleriaceae bacterium]